MLGIINHLEYWTKIKGLKMGIMWGYCGKNASDRIWAVEVGWQCMQEIQCKIIFVAGFAFFCCCCWRNNNLFFFDVKVLFPGYSVSEPSKTFTVALRRCAADKSAL